MKILTPWYFSLWIGLNGILILSPLHAATLTPLQGSPPSVLDTFKQQSIVGGTHDMRLVQQLTDKKGIIHTQYLQYFNNIPLWGYHIVTHGPKGHVQTINGTLVQEIESDLSKTIKPTLGKTEALTQVKETFQKQNSTIQWNYRNEKAQLFIYLDDSSTAHLVYHIDLLAQGDPLHVTRPQWIVDAMTGQLLKQWEGLTHDKIGIGPGGNVRMPWAPYEYGTSPPFDFLDVQKVGDVCRMQTADIKTVNYGEGSPFEYTCPRNTFQEVNGAYAPLNDAHFFGQKVFDMYRNWYGEAPISFPLQLNVHIPSYDNAYWDGSQATFGDGETFFHPLVGLDIISHEIAHGFTEFHSNLMYWGESGGINESFSDMAGEAAEFFLWGSNDWEVGSYISKENGPLEGNPLRYMCEPTLDGYSIDHTRDYYDGLDVHYSSGIFNKAFCLLARKMGWDTQKAFEVMAYANGYFYWSPSSTFVEGACGAIAAAKVLGYAAVDVYEAFLEVGADCPLPDPCVQLPVYSNETRQATLPFVEMPLYLDIHGQAIQLTGLYSAMLEIPFGFSDFQIKELTFKEVLTESNSCHAKFTPDTGTLEIPKIRVPTITPALQKIPTSGLNAECQATLRQSLIRPEVFSLTQYNCDLAE